MKVPFKFYGKILLVKILKAILLFFLIFTKLSRQFLSSCLYRLLFKMFKCSCQKNYNRVNNYSTMTVFDEKRESACSICFSNVFFKRIFHSIDSLPLTDYKKSLNPQRKMRCMSVPESSRLVGVVQTERGSQLDWFLSKYLLNLLLTYKKWCPKQKTVILNS